MVTSNLKKSARPSGTPANKARAIVELRLRQAGGKGRLGQSLH